MSPFRRARFSPCSSMMKTKLGLYIHIPFCAQRCAYCDFLLFPHAERFHMPYMTNLEREIERFGAERIASRFTVDSIFIGGGTPTLMPPDALKRLFGTLRATFEIDGDAEISVEANPNTLDDAMASALARCGVNRVSIGVQSASETLLAQCLRTHRASDVREAVSRLRSYGIANINFDFIFAIPGQTMADIDEDLGMIGALRPSHVSWYDLIIEDRTLLALQIDRGEMMPFDEDMRADCFEHIVSGLRALGYERYEISNFALPGRASRHNLKYWSGEDYLGLGLGAASYISGERYVNPRTFRAYEAALSCGQLPRSREPRTRSDDRFEWLMMGWRKLSGVSRAAFSSRFGEDVLALAPEFFERARARGVMDWTDEAVFMTPYGLDVLNDVLAELMLHLERQAPGND